MGAGFRYGEVVEFKEGELAVCVDTSQVGKALFYFLISGSHSGESGVNTLCITGINTDELHEIKADVEPKSRFGQARDLGDGWFDDGIKALILQAIRPLK